MASDLSDSDDIPNITQKEAEERCQQFIEVTGSDSACAMLYLQENEWNCQTAINAFFSKAVQGQPLVGSDDKSSSKLEEKNCVKIMSWNIDGLDTNNVKRRAAGVVKVINEELPDVILLQEVIEENQDILEKGCPKYILINAKHARYYVAVMILKSRVELIDQIYKPFPTSEMARGLLIIDTKIYGCEIRFLTSHLESTKPSQDERVKQLSFAFKEMSAKFTANVLAGDLNLRDNELNKKFVDENMKGCVDVWEAAGERGVDRYTWDMNRNDNLDFDNKRFKPRYRFDRMYLKNSEESKGKYLKVNYFKLSGLERIPRPVSRYCSDHWAIVAKFDICQQ